MKTPQKDQGETHNAQDQWVGEWVSMKNHITMVNVKTENVQWLKWF